MGFTTKILHVPFIKKDSHNALRFPTYGNAAFEFDSAEEIEAAFNGTKPSHAYSRSTNPTVEYLEKIVTTASDSFGCIALSSGMAAISNCIFAIASSGDEIISSNRLFGTTYSFFADTCKQLNISVKYVDFTNIKEVENAINKNTRALFFETITNPQIEIFDIDTICELAQKYNIVTICDITSTPPYLFNPKDWNINIAVISSTKFISGGGTAIGGFILDYGNYNWEKIPVLHKDSKKFGQFTFLKKLRIDTYRNIGACMSPFNASYFILGFETLELRIERACNNALLVADFLQKHPKVQSVHYAGLPSDNYNQKAKKYFKYPGSIICFELQDKQTCFSLINAVTIIRRATNLHDNKSLIIHPSSTIYTEFSDEVKKSIRISDTMIRLSVGIENPEDLISDLSQALNFI